MKKKSNKNKGIEKFSLLLFGILIGVLAGGSVMWWFSNKDMAYRYSDKLRDYIYSSFSFNNNNKNDVDKNKFKTQKFTKKKKEQNKKLTLQDSLLFNDPALGEYYEQMGGNIDSLLPDTSNYNFTKADLKDNEGPISYTEIVVQKDKLLFSKVIDIKEFENIGKNRKIALDSVLLNTKPSLKSKQNDILIEFWKSPVNFRGYKMSKNKIVIYGLQHDDNLRIEKHTNMFYLKNLDLYYLLEYTDSFKPLLVVKSPN